MSGESDSYSHDGHRKRLRERFVRGGMSALSDYEVIELLLTMCIPRIDVKPIAKDLIKAYGNLRGILDAVSIAIAHNHPGGDPRPSMEDVRFTKRLSDACRPINLSLIEHIVVGRNSCYSFRRSGEFDVLYDESLPPPHRSNPSRKAREQKVAEDGKDIQ